MKNPITVSVVINAPIEKIWKYWTEPEYIKKWNHASDDWCCPRATNDVRVGGNFSFRMDACDGSVGFDFEGMYTEVVPMQKIRYTIVGGRMVEVNFLKEGEGYQVTETFEAENENPLDMQRAGWQAILENFKKCVEIE